MIDEAVPAIRPIGSIASALKFGMIRPKQNSASDSRPMKTASGGGFIACAKPGEAEAGDEKAEQRRVRHPAHADANHDAAVEQRGGRHADRDDAEHQREQAAPSR